MKVFQFSSATRHTLTEFVTILIVGSATFNKFRCTGTKSYKRGFHGLNLPEFTGFKYTP